MRIQLASDLHLETHPDVLLEAAPGADVLVLAGDIGSYQTRSRLQDQDFGLERFSPLRHGGRWRRVIYVPGNHEFDALDFERTQDRLRETCERLGIDWLEREVRVIDGVRFVGTTLWSDFDALSSVGGGESGETRRLRAREKAFRAANFYLSKFTTLRDGQPVLAEGLRELGLACQDWLRQTLAQPFDGSTVVVTHFAPSLRSADPRYGVTPATAGFCNSLDDLLPQAQLWLHGHLHCPIDYVAEGVQEGVPYRCRVVANPYGYAHTGEQEGFRPRLLIEVPPPRGD